MSNTPGAQAQASKHAGQKQTFRHRRVAVAFFLFIGVPVYLGIHKKVASALDARALLIRKELEEARRLREEAEKVLADYQRKLGDVVMEVDNITALAAKQAETLAAETRQSLKEYDRCPNHLCAAPGPATVAITLLISVNLYVSLFLSLSLSLSLSTAASARLPPSMSLSSSSLAFSDSAPFGQGRLLRGRELSVQVLRRHMGQQKDSRLIAAGSCAPPPIGGALDGSRLRVTGQATSGGCGKPCARSISPG